MYTAFANRSYLLSLYNVTWGFEFLTLTGVVEVNA
jgi:hypothetical protein